MSEYPELASNPLFTPKYMNQYQPYLQGTLAKLRQKNAKPFKLSQPPPIRFMIGNQINSKLRPIQLVDGKLHLVYQSPKDQ